MLPDIGARDLIVRDIIQGLYDGRYEPGQRLYEAELTKLHGVSRGPVREALNALAAMNVVELTRQRGAQVRILTITEAIDTLVVAQNLIGLAARLAASNASAKEARARLEAVVDSLSAFPPDDSGAAFAVARDKFYGALIAMAANWELKRILPTVRVHLIRIQFRSMLRANNASRYRDYERIAEAVIAGREREAETAARAHIGRAIDRLSQFYADGKSTRHG